MENTEQPNSGPRMKRSLTDLLASAYWLRRRVPRPLQRAAAFLLGRRRVRASLSRWADPYPDLPDVHDGNGRVPLRLGIVRDIDNSFHKRYAAACLEMGVPYRVVDISGPDWLGQVAGADCAAYLVWPSVVIGPWKQMFDERLQVMEQEMGLLLMPGWKATWIYESKRRMADWLAAHRIATPRTWVFHSRERALEFAGRCKMPIVFKSDRGSGTSGVRVLRNRASIRRLIRRAFGRGFVVRDGDPRDRQWGNVLLQEFIPEAREWRMIRIGESYFGYEKLKAGDFHSGSHKWAYGRPPDDCLRMLRKVTERGEFRSMDIDILVGRDGRLLVSELQTVFGMGNPWEMCVIDGKPGRLLDTGGPDGWRFEPGRFCNHWMCNLRVEVVLQELNAGGHLPGYSLGDLEPDPGPEARRKRRACRMAR